MAEGLADLGVQASIGEGWGPWAAEILGDLGLRFDGHLAERVAAAAAPLNRVRQDAAILLHDRGADPDEVIAYLQRWSLVSADRAAQQLRFLTDPLWRAYISTYVEGFDLLSRWLAARPADQPVADRFLRLLDEPLTPRAGIAAELAGRLTVVARREPAGGPAARALDGGLARACSCSSACSGSATSRCSGRCCWSRWSGRLVALRPRRRE